MPQDAYTLRYVAAELARVITGSKITKINQTDKDTIDANLYTGEKSLRLTLCASAASARVTYAPCEKQPPFLPGSFCMLLRKYLTGGEILKVEQIGFERIIAVTVRCIGDFSLAERILYAELMGKYSNLILCENGIILGALKMTSLEVNSRRILFSGAKYELPEKQEKTDPTDLAALTALCANFGGGELARFIADNVTGVAYRTALQMEHVYDGSPLPDFIRNFLFRPEAEPCVVQKDGEPIEFYARLCDESEERIPFAGICAAEEYFYGYRTKAKKFQEKQRRLTALTTALKKKQEKNLARLLESRAECEDMEQNRIYGELVTANIYRIERGQSALEAINYYDEACPIVSVPLDPKLTPAQNAQRYYKKYNKQKRTLAATEPRIATERAEIEYAQTVLSSLSLAESTDDLIEIEEELISLGLIAIQTPKGKKRTAATAPFRRYTVSGFTVLGGRNNLSNDRLVKSASAEDIWLHTQKYHSSHVMIITEGKAVPSEVLLAAAEICAFYSDGKHGDKIPVDYCKRKFVKKPSGAKAGFVIYTDYKTLLVSPNAHKESEV